MEATEKLTITSNERSNSIFKFYNNLLIEFESKKLGYETLGLFVQSCLAGIAAMLILANDTSGVLKFVELFFVTILAMSFNSAFMINLKSKTALNLLIISVAFSLTMIVLNLFR